MCVVIHVCCLCLASKVGGIFDSVSDDEDFFTPSITVKAVPKTATAKKELTESDKKALRYCTCYMHIFHKVLIEVKLKF